jgi:endo-1,4-beta-xylanase
VKSKANLLFWALTALFLGACIPSPPEASPGAAAPGAPAGAPAGVTAADANAHPAALDAPPLRQAAERAGKKVGTAFMPNRLGEPVFGKVAGRHFDSLTPENEMKWDAIEPQQGTFRFEPADRLVAFAAENGMRVRGHTLVYHKQLASWVKDLSGDKLRAAVIAHVKGVVTHYKGKVAQWDVINEALSNKGDLTSESLFTALGPMLFDDAFRAAHEIDPQAQLFYNDYDLEGSGTPKVEGLFKLLKRLKDAKVPIDGVGLQMHVDPRNWPPAAEIRKTMEQIAAMGLVVEITEMDIPIGEVAGTPAQKLEVQRTLTHDIVAACMAVKACTGVTFWGVTDAYSWLNDPEWARLRGRMPHLPLLFDAEYRPKPVFNGVADAFAGR